MNTAAILSNIKWNTRQRLAYIETKAYYTGLITRSDVANAFAMSDPAATKDLKLYNDLAPGNLIYKQSEFGFVPNKAFRARLSDISPAMALRLFTDNQPSIWLATGGNPIFGINTQDLSLPARLPNKQIVAQLTRAICQHKKVKVKYRSLHDQQYQNFRVIEPHSIINTGLRWHLRAYNEVHFDFRDFVLSRILEAELMEASSESNVEYDEDWTESIELEFAPHPKLLAKQQENLLIDYSEDGKSIHLRVRRALIGYVLHALSVDTTADHSLNPSAFQLVLLNREEVEMYASWALL